MGSCASKANQRQSAEPVVPTEINAFPFVPLNHQGVDVSLLYDRLGTLGEGVSSQVYRVIERGTMKECAMKVMRAGQDKWTKYRFRQEVTILRSLAHPNIVSFEDCFVTGGEYYILTKLCTGPALFDRIRQFKHFSETKASEIMRSLLGAIKYCHDRNIVHRDIKPENIVYESAEPYSCLDIIDFGDAERIDPSARYDDFVGTFFYIAPESQRTRFGWELKASDMWALGVVAYAMVTGRAPFYGKDLKSMIRRTLRLKGRVHWPTDRFISDECKNFVRRLLTISTDERMTVDEALQHPWITEKVPDINFVTDVITHLDSFAHTCKLKKLLCRDPRRSIAVDVSNELTDEQRDQALQVFEQMVTPRAVKRLQSRSSESGTPRLDRPSLTASVTSSLTPSVKSSRSSSVTIDVDDFTEYVLNKSKYSPRLTPKGSPPSYREGSPSITVSIPKVVQLTPTSKSRRSPRASPRSPRASPRSPRSPSPRRRKRDRLGRGKRLGRGRGNLRIFRGRSEQSHVRPRSPSTDIDKLDSVHSPSSSAPLQLSTAQVRDLSLAVFQAMDKDGDGELTFEEFAETYAASLKCNGLFEPGCSSGSKLGRRQKIVTVDQVEKMLTQEPATMTEKPRLIGCSAGETSIQLHREFSRMDVDGNGYITASDLLQTYEDELTPQTVRHVIEEVDLNKDGKISYSEFKLALALGSVVVRDMNQEFKL